MTHPVIPAARATRAGRRAEQRRERRRRQVRLTGALLGVLALLAAGFAVWLAKDAPGDDDAGEGAVRTQRTVVLEVKGPDGAGLSTVLLAHDAQRKEGAAVLVPPQVLVNVPGSGSVAFGKALLRVSPETSRNALSDLLGVTVDHHWVLDQGALQRLVDALGGVEAEVDVQVVRGQTVLLEPGTQQLDGGRAYAFMTHLAEGEQEQSRLARVQEVLDGIIRKLPDDPAALATVLGRLGPQSVSSQPLPQLAALLVGLASDDAAGELQYDVLPVVDLDPGGGVVAFRLDAVPARALVDRLLADSVPEGVRAGGKRVLVLNGVGTPGLGERVRGKLVPAGFVVVDTRNANAFGYAQTQVLVNAATPAGQALGERVAKALGVPVTAVARQDLGTVADVAVLVGADFKP